VPTKLSDHHVVEDTVAGVQLWKKEAKITGLCLVYLEYESLAATLQSYEDGGLFDYLDEFILMLNGEVKSPKEIPEIQPFMDKMTVIQSFENLSIGNAIIKLVKAANHEMVIFLEKDFQLIEPEPVMKRRMNQAIHLVNKGEVDLVRFRHRKNSGFPNYALIMGQNREEIMFGGQSNLWCCVHYWMDDPVSVYPNKFSWCPSTVDWDEPMLCAESQFCQWTNNPEVFRQDWFIREFADPFTTDPQAQDPNNGMHDFEFWMNWKMDRWNQNQITVGSGEGLFIHGEKEDHVSHEQRWYAIMRRNIDSEEIRKVVFQKEDTLRAITKDVDFAGDMLHNVELIVGEKTGEDWRRADKWLTDDVRGILQGLGGTVPYLKASERYPPGIYDLIQYKGPMPHKEVIAKATEIINSEKDGLPALMRDGTWNKEAWKWYKQRQHQLAEDLRIQRPMVDPFEMNITLVTGVWDLGRGHDSMDQNFKRDFSMYTDALLKWIQNINYAKLVFCTNEVRDVVLAQLETQFADKPDFIRTIKLTTRFVHFTMDDVMALLPEDCIKNIEKIRNDPKWFRYADWLTGSPQASLPWYNPLVMSKIYLNREAARLNPFKTTNILWIDVKHNCLRNDMSPANDWIIRESMTDRYLFTHFEYGPGSNEVHGFRATAFNRFLGLDPKKRHRVKVVRGGILGCNIQMCETTANMYTIALMGSLMQGYMGTEENILSILLYNFPEWFHSFNNDNACLDNPDPNGDHACAGVASPHGNCAIFEWVANSRTGRTHRSAMQKSTPIPQSQFNMPTALTNSIDKDDPGVVCCYQSNNWMVLYTKERCETKLPNAQFNASPKVNKITALEDFGECMHTGGQGSFSWTQRTDCECFGQECKDTPCEGENSLIICEKNECVCKEADK
jgi:hypothetical protein